MAKLLDEPSRKAIAARIRYYRDLGIYDFYRRPVPPGMSLGAAIERQPMACLASPAAESQLLETRPAEEASGAGFDAAGLAQLLQDKPSALRVIREDLGECTRCRLSRGRTNLVFGVGDPQTRIMFVGEGPGADEDAQGEPFVGRAGQLLNNMIQAMGLRRDQVYIANVVKCRPPENRTPERDECESCGPFLMRQIAVVRPEIIVALGATAAKFLLGLSDSMAKLRGRVYDFHPILPKGAPERDPGFATRLVVTYHPAYLLRDPRQKKEAWLDLQMAMKELGMAVPKRAPEA
jgi:uracil-DNA glycosylase